MALHQVRPRILGFISEDVSAWLVASLVLLAGTVLTGLLTWAMMNLFNQQLRQRFELQAEERFSRIEEHFQDQEQRLDSLRRFFANSEGVSNTEFRGYADALLRRTRAFAWAPRVLRDERQSFEQHAQAEGPPNSRSARQTATVACGRPPNGTNTLQCSTSRARLPTGRR